MAGVKNVLATSGTAFTEMQVRLLSRFTKRVVVNFDPDLAGATAAEKSIALLTEEGFEVKVIALEGGLDPDRFVREQGIEAYMAALRGAKRHSDYLIERARQMFPGRNPDAKVKALNFLLPHISRMPNRIHRDEFVADAAQKLGIDSAVMRQELKQAAAQRLSSVRSRQMEPASETERVLLRALVLPERDEARGIAAEALAQHPEWYEGVPAAALFDALAHGAAPDNPLDAAPDDASRAMLAEVLASQPEVAGSAGTLHKIAPQTMAEQVGNALLTLKTRYLERRQRELRSAIAEAERRGDHAMVETLTLEKMKVDRALREL
jgi:DNA primase